MILAASPQSIYHCLDKRKVFGAHPQHFLCNPIEIGWPALAWWERQYPPLGTSILDEVLRGHVAPLPDRAVNAEPLDADVIGVATRDGHHNLRRLLPLDTMSNPEASCKAGTPCVSRKRSRPT